MDRPYSFKWKQYYILQVCSLIITYCNKFHTICSIVLCKSKKFTVKWSPLFLCRITDRLQRKTFSGLLWRQISPSIAMRYRDWLHNLAPFSYLYNIYLTFSSSEFSQWRLNALFQTFSLAFSRFSVKKEPNCIVSSHSSGHGNDLQ